MMIDDDDITAYEQWVDRKLQRLDEARERIAALEAENETLRANIANDLQFNNAVQGYERKIEEMAGEIMTIEAENERLVSAFEVIAKGWHSPAITYSRHILMGKSIEEATKLGWIDWDEVETALNAKQGSE